jgi:hypothetical protein
VHKRFIAIDRGKVSNNYNGEETLTNSFIIPQKPNHDVRYFATSEQSFCCVQLFTSVCLVDGIEKGFHNFFIASLILEAETKESEDIFY